MLHNRKYNRVLLNFNICIDLNLKNAVKLKFYKNKSVFDVPILRIKVDN